MRKLLFATFLLSFTMQTGCKEKEPENWTTSPGLQISAIPVEEGGKRYLNVFYENFGEDTIKRIRYELITTTAGKTDTAMKEINPPELLRPKDRHLVPRAIGEKEITFDEVRVGKVEVLKR